MCKVDSMFMKWKQDSSSVKVKTSFHWQTDIYRPTVALCSKVPNAEKCIKINIRRAFLSPIIIFQQLKNKYVKCQQKILFKKYQWVALKYITKQLSRKLTWIKATEGVCPHHITRTLSYRCPCSQYTVVEMV